MIQKRNEVKFRNSVIFVFNIVTNFVYMITENKPNYNTK